MHDMQVSTMINILQQDIHPLADDDNSHKMRSLSVKARWLSL